MVIAWIVSRLFFLLSDFSKLFPRMVETPFICLCARLDIFTKTFVSEDKENLRGNFGPQWFLYADMAFRRLDQRGSMKVIKEIRD